MNTIATPAIAHRPAGVDKTLVHKQDAEQVLLSGWKRTGPDSFLLAADWTGAGRSGVRGAGDSQLLVETIRQTFPLLSHEAYDVPFGHHLLWDQYRHELNVHALRDARVGGTPELEIRCREVVRRGCRVSALSMDITVRLGDVRLATAYTRFTVQKPTVYQRLRGSCGDVNTVMTRAAALPLPPPMSGLGSDFRDVVLSPTDESSRWRLRVDVHHPLYFDHPNDHAPGLLLLEAAQQAACVLRGPACADSATTMETIFHRYVELGVPCDVVAQRLPDDQRGRSRVLVTTHQQGMVCFTGLVTMTPENAA